MYTYNVQCMYICMCVYMHVIIMLAIRIFTWDVIPNTKRIYTCIIYTVLVIKVCLLLIYIFSVARP